MANLTKEQRETERALHAKRPYRRVNADLRLKFLRALARTGNVTYSAKHAGLSIRNIYAHAKRNVRFANKMNEAREHYAASLEVEALRRGRDGYAKEVYQNGELVGTETRYSDRLLETMLRAAKPDKYGKQTVTLEGNEHNPVALTAVPAKSTPIDTNKLRNANPETHARYGGELSLFEDTPE